MRPIPATSMPACRKTLAEALLALALCLGAAGPDARAADPVAVEMVNASRKTGCAEEDNVYVKFLGAGIAGFRIEVRHPPYIREVTADSTAPDFTRCDMSHDPSFAFAPRDVTLFDDGRYKLLGHTFKSNWRPDVVPFRVGARTERGLHLVQLFKYVGGAAIEIVVLYPADGYWRAKPLPPTGFPETAYGSSFLIGPIEEAGRPLVALSDIEFDPVQLSFALAFARGGSGRLTVTDARPDGLDLEIALTPPVPAGRPFAALRSMFVTPLQADVSEAGWRTASGIEERQPILDFATASVVEARFGRVAKSLHNLSAPDFVLGGFRQ
jgi:hypothetical protein